MSALDVRVRLLQARLRAIEAAPAAHLNELAALARRRSAASSTIGGAGAAAAEAELLARWLDAAVAGGRMRTFASTAGVHGCRARARGGEAHA